jgi:hypothetical protein
LTLGPIHHDGTIIDCEDNDFLNPLGAESVLFLLVVGDLLCGSGGSECSLFRGERLQDERYVNNCACKENFSERIRRIRVRVLAE